LPTTFEVATAASLDADLLEQLRDAHAAAATLLRPSAQARQQGCERVAREPFAQRADSEQEAGTVARCAQRHAGFDECRIHASAPRQCGEPLAQQRTVRFRLGRQKRDLVQRRARFDDLLDHPCDGRLHFVWHVGVHGDAHALVLGGSTFSLLLEQARS
jgi:hypothetical protein